MNEFMRRHPAILARSVRHLREELSLRTSGKLAQITSESCEKLFRKLSASTTRWVK